MFNYVEIFLKKVRWFCDVLSIFVAPDVDLKVEGESPFREVDAGDR